MARFKIISYIFIPVLAILLMSHNSYALELTDNSVHYYGTYSNVYTYCSDNNTWAYECSGSTQNREAVRFYDNAATFPSGGYYIEIYLEIANWDGNAPLWYGASSSGNINIVQEEQVSSTTRGNTTTRVYRLIGRWTGGTAITSSYPGIILNTSYLGAWSHYKVQYFTLWQVVSADASNQQIIDAINNISSGPSAQDIADAVNEPEEEAVDNIENQSTSSTPAPDTTAATNIIGQISGIFTQIGNIPVSSTCSIAANFGNLNLGDINLCSGKENLPFVVTFGAYAFEVIFAINIGIILVKQVLGLFDWDRK